MVHAYKYLKGKVIFIGTSCRVFAKPLGFSQRSRENHRIATAFCKNTRIFARGFLGPSDFHRDLQNSRFAEGSFANRRVSRQFAKKCKASQGFKGFLQKP